MTIEVPGRLLASTPSQSSTMDWSTLNVHAVQDVETVLLYLFTSRPEGSIAGDWLTISEMALIQDAPPGQAPLDSR
ncbi:hypothetical protein A9C11_32245 (plasmid) [Pseudomonas citronellolis]|uniref:Uncharacterized protein n=1 Tax=Pseudomonas citronellolis TaxID=53408 RepID=A0A1A9KMI2_9PSED|nr:hypothetical protein A9C11_32245 [Pseudomonas citronellolis]KWR75093.1 hypothetical protein RN02_23860 [Pseudomonas sp. PI1]